MMFHVKNFLTVVVAVVLVLVGYEFFNKKRAEQYVSAAQLHDGFLASNNVKIEVVSYYIRNNEFPNSNKDVGIPPPENFASQSLIKLQVLEKGIISLTYNENSGINNGVIKLIPRLNEGIGMDWRCVTSSYENISLTTPQCEFIEEVSSIKVN